MQRVSLSYIYEFVNKIEPLARLPDAESKYSDVWITLWIAQGAIEQLFNNSVYSAYLRTASVPGQELLESLKKYTEADPSPEKLLQWQAWQIRDKHTRFKTVLLADLSILNTYLVTQKGGFDVVTLLFNGEALYPADLAQKVPEALFDAREAAKCFAYEASTACGYHMFRAMEAVLRRYYAHVTGGLAPPKVRSIGVYVAAMKKAGKGDAKTLFALGQIAELHRNPLIHPETVLSIEDATAVYGLARSAISRMLADLPAATLTTATVPATVTS